MTEEQLVEVVARARSKRDTIQYLPIIGPQINALASIAHTTLSVIYPEVNMTIRPFLNPHGTFYIRSSEDFVYHVVPSIAPPK